MTPQLKVLLQKISHHSLFKKHDFTLIGGTALSFHLKHRISEDLDFVISGALPQNDIKELLKELKANGSTVVFKPQSDQTLYDYEEACDDIHEDHQDWIVDGVKLTFVNSRAFGDDQQIILSDIPTLYHGVKIASVDTIFKMKSLLILDRTKSRDYFDLLTLYAHDNTNYSPCETIKLIKDAHPLYKNNEDILQELLENRDCGTNDETLDGLLDNQLIPSFKELKERLNDLLLNEF